MYNSIIKNFTKSLAIFSFIIIFLASPAFSEEANNVTELTNEAEQYLLKGEYRKSIIIYDNILEFFPAEPKIHEMKGIALSNRHKSGVALRFPRIKRWRKDKPASEIDTIESVKALIGS